MSTTLGMEDSSARTDAQFFEGSRLNTYCEAVGNFREVEAIRATCPGCEVEGSRERG